MPDDADEISALIVALSEPFYLHPSRAGAELFLSSISSESVQGYVSAPDFFYQVAVAESVIAEVVAVRDNSHLFHLLLPHHFSGRDWAAASGTLQKRMRRAREIQVNSP